MKKFTEPSFPASSPAGDIASQNPVAGIISRRKAFNEKFETNQNYKKRQTKRFAFLILFHCELCFTIFMVCFPLFQFHLFYHQQQVVPAQANVVASASLKLPSDASRLSLILSALAAARSANELIPAAEITLAPLGPIA